jgi:hypothetical protein
MKSKKLGECCPVMDMVTRRDTSTQKPRGFEIATMFHLNGKATRDALVYRFAKAKRGDETEFGAKSKFAGTTFAAVEFCPWCGEKVGIK